MNISEFRSIGGMRNALVVLDSKTDEIKVTPQTLIRRTVAWLKARISPSPMAAAERDAAHNRFLRAIANHSGYDRGDVSRAEALLSVDVLERKPLSSRRIREVIQDLDQRSTPTLRENRTTAVWMSSRGVDLRLAERAPGVSLSEPDREALAAKVQQAIHAAGGEGARRVDFNAASAVTNQAVDGFLDARAARIEAAARAQALERSRAQAPEQGGSAQLAGREGDATAPPADPPPLGAAAGAAGLGADDQPAPAPPMAAETSAADHPAPPDRATRKDLLRTLGKAKLPGKLKPALRKLIKNGGIRDAAELARKANEGTADWVMNNRVGKWYGEALMQQGARGKIKHGEELMASSAMLRRVTESIAGAKDVLNYSDVKSQSRALIAAHVRSEIDGRNA